MSKIVTLNKIDWFLNLVIIFAILCLSEPYRSKILANKAMVYMVAGVKERHKMAVAYDLTNGSLNRKFMAKRISDVIRFSKAEGGQISSLVMDSGGPNQGI